MENNNPEMFISKPIKDYNMQDDMYARNTSAVSELNPKESVALHIVGLGGIGSWVAFIASYIYNIEYMVLWDDDIVELSNLARTPYNLSSINSPKVEAISAIISSRRPDLEIYPFNKKFTPENILALNSNKELSSCTKKYLPHLIIDCRDDYYGDYTECRHAIRNSKMFHAYSYYKNQSVKFIRAAYDTKWITYDPDPENRPVHGQGGYSIQPSHIHPAIFSAILATLSINLHDSKLLKDPITFDITNIFKYIQLGQQMLENKDPLVDEITKHISDGTLNSKNFKLIDILTEVKNDGISFSQEKNN